jgi:hypothetical protein
MKGAAMKLRRPRAEARIHGALPYGTVGNGCRNDPADVLWVKQALDDLGRYRDRHERHG